MGRRLSPPTAAAWQRLLGQSDTGYLTVQIVAPRDAGQARVRVVSYPPRASYSQRSEWLDRVVPVMRWANEVEFYESAAEALRGVAQRLEDEAARQETDPLF